MVGATSKWGRLFTCFLLPAVVYIVVRQVRITQRDWGWLLWALVGLGVYLAFTAVLEVAKCWSLVFPHYIADPALGIHFGRARGPDLNAVSLGLYLTACLACAWMLVGVVGRRWQQLLLLVVMPLMAFGVLLTYTRSTWIGLGASAFVVAAIELPRRWRWPSLIALMLVGPVIVAASWSHVTCIEREGTAEDSNHSVDQRTSFTYVSWQMFRVHPVLGVGFGRFFDQKLPYLSDRSQNFELESIRSLNHHNTLLSSLTETGLIGFAAFLGVFVAWCRCAWSLAKDLGSSRWVRAQGILMLALMTNYLSSALFHDLTLMPSQQMLLFLFAGITVNLRHQNQGNALRLFGGRRANMLATQRNLFGMRISPLTMQDTVVAVLEWCAQPRNDSCRYLVTPNVDHVIMFQRNVNLRAAYAEASLVLADGMPIVVAARLVGRFLPERVAGSDLAPRLFAAADRPLRIFLLGAAPGVAETAARNIGKQWPSVKVVGTYSPPIGFEEDTAENARIFAAVAAASPDLLILGLGAPKQEIWMHAHRHQLHAKVALCGGATIDFLAGHRHRSPVWMRRTGLEWLHRLCAEPRRLASRYARDAWIFPQLVWQEWRQLWA
jgi:N-acetylglucosaminyldiphosphoundecaprenol N-acetyl-beta-D-mannosaminyltransferase